MHISLSTVVSGLLGRNVFANASPSSELTKRDSRTSPPSGCLTVGSSGTYSTINAALTALGTGSSTSTACVFIYAGIYASSSQVYINYEGALTLYGYTSKSSVKPTMIGTVESCERHCPSPVKTLTC